MPKKPPPNGYYYFMRDWKEREERVGRRFANGMKDVAEFASDDWKKLSPAEKERYNKIAKEHRHDPRPNIPKQEEKRFNSFGVSFAQIERERIAKEKKLQSCKDFVHEYVSRNSIEELKVQSFFLIHVNYFCKTDHGEYLPAEIAISEFSLLNGVQKVLHRFLSPGQIPTGYACEVKEHSDKYHKIPFDSVKSNCRLEDVYREVCDFIKGKFDNSKYPPLFSLTDQVFDNTSISAVKNTLQRLWEGSNYHNQNQGDWEDVFQVYSLAQLFYEIKKKCLSGHKELIAFPNDIVADSELRKDLYHFHGEMACEFHRDIDNIAFCSQSYVIRWAHIIRDHCCIYINIEDVKLPESYDKDAQILDNLDSLTLNDEDDDESKFDDCKSTRSGFTSISEKSVDFRSVKSAKTAISMPSVQSLKTENSSPSMKTSWASAASQPSKTPSVKSWATASQPQKAPVFDNKNFPSLGCGRGRVTLEKRNPAVNE